MNYFKIKLRLKYFSISVFLMISLIIGGCQSPKKSKPQIKIDKELLSGQDNKAIVSHLMQLRKSTGVSSSLAIHYPNLKRDRAYEIQMEMLTEFEKQGEQLVGWKMGGANINNPEMPFDPLFGFMLASNELKSGQIAKSINYANDSPLIEAEIGFVISKDLKGPVVSREELIDAIKYVGGFSELISLRIEGIEGGKKATVSHFIADGLSHGGFIQPEHLFELDEVDFHAQQGRVEINGDLIAEGDSKNYAFIEAVLLLANSLPKYGRNLREGDVVITGSILVSPPAKANDDVKIIFSDFETLKLKFE